jgi:predicted ribosomally synthesized peptide with SipW-like signal peptide
MTRAHAALVLAGLAGGGALACFSDRAQVTGPPNALCQLPLGADVAGSTLVVVRGFAFAPTTVRVRSGGSVTWVNCEPEGTPAHTTTADQGAWGSPLLAPGEAYTFTFGNPGQFAYHCEPHPFMTATIVVE